MEHWCGEIRFFLLILVLQPLIGSHSGICHPMWWVTERTHWVTLFLFFSYSTLFLFLLLSFPSSSSSSSSHFSQGFTVIPILFADVCVPVKCSSSLLSVMHVDRVWREGWRKDMSLHASMFSPSTFPQIFGFMFYHRLQSKSAANDNPTEDLLLLNCVHARPGLVL